MRISVYAVQYPGRQDRLGDPLVMSLAVLRAEPALAEVVLPPLRRWGADDTVLAMLAALPSDYIQPKKLVQSSFTGPSL
ncbi:hypothetical protein [Mycobacterium simiae]|uniref:Uncharacterized protein n=1 Tax=Mycobacterium simiae TaxID=1784 RepID=A0A1X0YFK9_MYCSI|nr:hypothetical protein [Mycobacterium simiae]ORJ63988.1 hypothetical protein B5M45_01805 [Mycobacterium simiae]